MCRPEIIGHAVVGTVVVVAMMLMRHIAMIMRMDDGIGEAARWYCESHAKSWRNGKQQRKRPRIGGAAFAGLFQSSDHAPAHSARIDAANLAFLNLAGNSLRLASADRIFR